MPQCLINLLDWFGICVFAVTSILVASREQMDIAGFARLDSVTGMGGRRDPGHIARDPAGVLVEITGLLAFTNSTPCYASRMWIENPRVTGALPVLGTILPHCRVRGAAS